MKNLLIVAVVLFGIAGFSSQAKAWSCAETHYSCSAGTSGNESESASKWTWTCSDEAGSLLCSEDKPVEKIVTVEKIVEVPVEKIVIKEVPVEKIVEKEVIKEVPVEKIIKETIYKKKIVYKEKHDKDKKKDKVKAKVLPATGVPIAGLAGITLGTAALYALGKRFFKK